MPWKSNPVVIFYNKAMFTAAGLDPEAPALSTYDEFLDTSRTLTESGAAPYAIYPAPSSQFYQSWFDFYPLYGAETRRHAARRRRQGDVRLRSRHSGVRVLGDDVRGGPRRAGSLQRRLVRRWQLGHDDRRALGHRLLRATRRLGHRSGADLEGHAAPRRPTPSAMPRTSACSPRARTRARRGMC